MQDFRASLHISRISRVTLGDVERREVRVRIFEGLQLVFPRRARMVRIEVFVVIVDNPGNPDVLCVRSFTGIKSEQATELIFPACASRLWHELKKMFLVFSDDLAACGGPHCCSIFSVK